jgi:hypothetical protein
MFVEDITKVVEIIAYDWPTLLVKVKIKTVSTKGFTQRQGFDNAAYFLIAKWRL